MTLRIRRDPLTGRGIATVIAAENDERRWALRKSGIVPAYIISDSLGGPVSCVVRDISATGAKVELKIDRHSVIGSAEGLPKSFVMVLQREFVAVECHIAWRTERMLGVRFVSTMKHMPKQPTRLPPRVKR